MVFDYTQNKLGYKSLYASLKARPYLYNQTYIKLYGYGNNKKIKLITMNCVRNSDLEINNYKNAKCSVNSVKLDDNIARAKSKIFELAFCNEWEYFFTGTIDKSKYDRTDLEKFHKDLTQFINNKNKKLGCKIKFLFIPELHSDGKSWHIHGFLYGIPKKELTQFCVGDIMGKSLAEKVKNGDIVFNWNSYSKKFGFNDLEPIRNHEAVAKYITKYINKNLASSVTELNAHLYYHSRGLNTAKIIKKGSMSANIEPTYTNDYCSITWLDYSEELLNELKNSCITLL